LGNPDTSDWWLPLGVTVDDSESVYVSKNGGLQNYIIKFDSSGNALLRWGSRGTGQGQFGMLYELGTGEKYRVFVPDAPDAGVDNHRVQKFTTGGQFITMWGTQGSGNGQFEVPFGIVVDSLGNVYVSDPALHRIQKFRKTIVGINVSEQYPKEKLSLALRCFPNPIRTTAIFRFRISSQAACLKLFNVNGNQIQSFVITGNKDLQDLRWDGKDGRGHIVPSGVYFASLESGDRFTVTRITVVR
jgi:hypothetical protein